MINRFEWLKAVTQAEDLTPAAKTIATALAVYFINEKDGHLNPRRETIADYVKIHPDTVKRLLKDPIRKRWLAEKPGLGRGLSTQYRLTSPGKIMPFRAPKKGGKMSPLPIIRKINLLPKSARARANACPVRQTVLVESGSHRRQAWEEWLDARGWPSVAQLDVRHSDATGVGWRMPFILPPRPDDILQLGITEKFLNWACSRMAQPVERGRASG